MIEINLLPESMRKAEATPLPRFVALCVGILMVSLLLVVNLHFKRNLVPDEENQLDLKQQEKAEKEAQVGTLNELRAEIAAIEEHVGVVRELYDKRRVWAKLLYDLKRIVTFDKTADESNPQLRYIWLTSVRYSKGRGGEETMSLDGFATANGDEVDSARLAQRFFNQLLRYKVDKVPVEEERERLQTLIAELQQKRQKAQQDWATLREENPGLQEVSPDVQKIDEDIAALQANLDGLEDTETGLVALKPFAEFFGDGGIQLTSLTWGKAPGGKDLGENPENVPEEAHAFRIECTFEQDASEAAGRPGRP